jgi:hypothetical protein
MEATQPQAMPTEFEELGVGSGEITDDARNVMEEVLTQALKQLQRQIQATQVELSTHSVKRGGAERPAGSEGSRARPSPSVRGTDIAEVLSRSA